MSEINWKKEAPKALEIASRDLSEAHRGVIQWHGPANTFLAFDNRAIPEKQIKWLKSRFAKLDIVMLAVATDHEESFVMLVETADPKQLLDLFWESFWHAAGKKKTEGFEVLQRAIVAHRLYRRDSGSENLWDQQLSGKNGDPSLNLFEAVERLELFRRHKKKTNSPFDVIASIERLVEHLAKKYELTGKQIIQLYRAFPNQSQWKGQTVNQMYAELYPTRTAKKKTGSHSQTMKTNGQKKMSKAKTTRNIAKSKPAKKKI